MNKARALKDVLYRQRYSNTQGHIIPTHHSLARIHLSHSALAVLFFLPVLADIGLWYWLENIFRYWHSFFAYWVPLIAPKERIGMHDMTIFGQAFHMPYPAFHAAIPTRTDVAINLIITSLLFLILLPVPDKFLPLAYFCRAVILIQFSASVFFLLSPTPFPYELSGYLCGQMIVGVCILFLVPPLLALIYYIMDVPLLHKLTLTLLTLGYFVIALPFQYLLQGCMIRAGTYLFLPVLYLLFGTLLDVLMFIAFYSWAMTWGLSRRTNRRI